MSDDEALGGLAEGLFDVAEVIGLGEVMGPLPAMLVCEAEACGGHRKCDTRAEADAFTARHIALHGGRVRIGCWPQRPDSLASLLSPTDTVAWPSGPYDPKGTPP